MRDGDWKLLMMEDGSHPQLYNLAKDYREKQNLANQRPDMVERMSKQLLEWRKTLPIASPPPWNPNHRSPQETGPS